MSATSSALPSDVYKRQTRSYGFDPVRDIQVLCPTKLGPTGTQALNVELQNLLNPEQKGCLLYTSRCV